MKTLLMICVVALISGCGGTDCPDTNTRTLVHTLEGSYWVVCTSFQCPGFPIETRCKVE
jgi:hypothetical protein